eukprot:9260035-Karenia_brevis.AAC.1
MSSQRDECFEDTFKPGNEEGDCHEPSEQPNDWTEFLGKQCYHSNDNEPLDLHGEGNGDLFCSTRHCAGPQECRDV